MDRIRLGCRAKDAVTGFEGTVTARFEYLNGCLRYMVEAPSKEQGGKPEELVFDEERLDVTGEVDARWEHVEARLAGDPIERGIPDEPVLSRTGGARPTPRR